jgi:HlyD family secretion protein
MIPSWARIGEFLRQEKMVCDGQSCLSCCSLPQPWRPGWGIWSFWSKSDKAAVFSTALVKRGNVVTSISATGTIEPEAAVDIGAQVAGVIIAFGKDEKGKLVSWGSVVDVGTVLARIDDSLYSAAVQTAKAQLGQGEANVLATQANVLQQKANLPKNLVPRMPWHRAPMTSTRQTTR